MKLMWDRENRLYSSSVFPQPPPPLQQPLGQQEAAARRGPHLVVGRGWGGGEKTGAQKGLGKNRGTGTLKILQRDPKWALL